MANIYCTKCGVRGWSKCPHCRSIFLSKFSNDYLIDSAQEFFETFFEIRKTNPEVKPLDDGTARWEVSTWTYAKTSDEAMLRILERMKELLNTPGINLKVAACVHHFELMPGEKSSIGCGHVGAMDIVIPPDPFAVKDT